MGEYDPFDWYWIVGGDDSRFWSSKAGAWVDEMPDGAGVTRIASEAELDEVLAAYGLLGPTARRKVRKSVVQARLIAAGKMDAAYAALTQMPAAFARWFAPDRPEVYADDPDALALLAAIGADPEEIMGPE
jgi:CTP:molybdopterin cytidylyltransferase MocA